MLPATPGFRSRVGFRDLSLKCFELVWRQKVLRGEAHEFLGAKSIMAKGGFVHGKEAALLQIKYPHGLRIFGKKKAILGLGFLKDGFGMLAAHDFLLQSLIGARKAGG